MTEADDYTFRGKRSNEEVLLVARQHPWVLMPIFWVWLLLVAIIVGAVWQLGFSGWSSYLIFAVLAFGCFYSLYQWFVWNNSNYVVTDQRVIKIDQKGLFSREISEAEIDRIQEISTEIKGPMRTLFNFGRVKIQTASSSGRVDMEDVIDPYNIQQRVVQIQRRTRPVDESKPLPPTN